ncbi:undecaprenyldiphospho-muramoylpentapeptide beta-N-acetylglucosaminyltransferase [bacterium]|nr:undecaprenyldiphospho-muramoylpentapeptide beta-N-acetylglucosaminyltransferase [bacterium]MDD5918508.1 undecaprenyldiphospho-muramoylpentapeptide beta-N-acetylglucosaminyltransferase [bacterium]
MEKKIILTGGGSAGHVTPNLALLPQLQAEGIEVHYIGTADGIERTIVSERSDITYHVISSGKLRRYFSWKNFTDPFRVLRGMFQARRIMREVKPAAVFSKGGFVSVPVVIAAHGKHIPVVTHESDYTPGLANKINAKFADKICVTFEDTLSHVGAKGVHTGTPIRPELYEGDKARGLSFLGFDDKKPILLVMGGSLGAAAVNDAVRAALPKLLASYDIVHLCGKGKVEESLAQPGYRQFEYVNEELPDVLAATDIVVSRAGANAVFEFLALSKPALLIPLPRSASRGDQILNAGYFARKGFAMVLEQESLTPETLLDAVNDLYDRRLSFIATMSAEPLADGTDEVLAVIRSAMEKK